jgi:hypothetical protein
MALVKIKTEKEVNAEKIFVKAEVRYWENATVNEIEDVDGSLVPCRSGDYWMPAIDIDTGIITNWKQGIKARIHYKICDAGVYQVRDNLGVLIMEKDGYVPDIMCPGDNGYGDYIIMHVDENGKIENWKVSDLKELLESNDND